MFCKGHEGTLVVVQRESSIPLTNQACVYACNLKRDFSGTLIEHHFYLIYHTMSVLLETSLGDIVIDLLVAEAPKCCEK